MSRTGCQQKRIVKRDQALRYICAYIKILSASDSAATRLLRSCIWRSLDLQISWKFRNYQTFQSSTACTVETEKKNLPRHELLFCLFIFTNDFLRRRASVAKRSKERWLFALAKVTVDGYVTVSYIEDRNSTSFFLGNFFFCSKISNRSTRTESDSREQIGIIASDFAKANRIRCHRKNGFPYEPNK